MPLGPRPSEVYCLKMPIQGLLNAIWVQVSGPEVGLDACMANLMRPGMYNAYHHITIIPNSEQVPGLPDREQDASTILLEPF